MALKVSNSKSISWPVDVALPVSGGKFEVHQFTMHFKRLNDQEIEAIEAKYPDKAPKSVPASSADAELVPTDEKTPAILPWAERAARIYFEQCDGWSDITDGDGAPLAWTVEQLRTLFEGPDGFHFNRGIRKAVSEMRLGTPEALEKN